MCLQNGTFILTKQLKLFIMINMLSFIVLVVSGCISVITYVYIIIIKLVFKITDVKLA